jgi:hypothetical protein
MKTFSSLAAVVALWLGVSFVFWLAYVLFRRHDGSRQKQITAAALGLMEEGTAVFAALRSRASDTVSSVAAYRRIPDNPKEALQDDVRALLNAIEAKSAYFDSVKAAKKKIEKAFVLPDFAPLSEILQIRRDLWAASEIFLIDDLRVLGPEFSEASSYETFQAEALALLFKDKEAARLSEGDPVDLRLSIARGEAAAFAAHAEEAIAADLEKSRFPTPAEIMAVPLGAVRAAVFLVREGRTVFRDAAATAQSFVRFVGSKGFMAAAEELRKVRGDLPSQFASAFERAGGLARKGGDGLKRHYEFLLEAQELRARYAELLARTPIVTEKGKQFLARLELERRAEQFCETSGGVSDWARQKLVLGIAYLIRGLQYVQAKITPPQNKQLAMRPAAAAEPAASASEEPFRVLLLPSAAYAGGNHGRSKARGSARTRNPGQGQPRPEPSYETPPRESNGRLRDLVTGDAPLSDYGAAVAEAPRSRPNRPASVKSSESLLHRLSNVHAEGPPESEELALDAKRKGRSFGFAKSKRG